MSGQVAECSHVLGTGKDDHVCRASAEVLKQEAPLRFVASKDSEFDSMRKFYRTTLVKVELQ